jgi:dephospho-CoA kinase
MTRLIICPIGLPGSGKTTASDFLISHLGCSYFSISEVIKISALAHQVDITQFQDLHDYARIHRDRNGRTVFTRYTIEIIKQRSWSRAVLDGCRTAASVRMIRSFGGELGWRIVAIGLSVPIDLAISRIVERSRSHDRKDLAEIENYVRSNSEACAESMQSCDFVINNVHSENHFLESLANLPILG